MHFTNTPTTKIGGAGNSLSLDLSGLRIHWGGNELGRYEDDVLGCYEPANVTCLFNCGDGESHLLTYRMLISGECGPERDPSCFGRDYQYVHLVLRGMIIGNDLPNVPVPAAAWLLGSGLLGLLGLAKRKTI